MNNTMKTLLFSIAYLVVVQGVFAVETAYDLREDMTVWYEFENDTIYDQVRGVSAVVSDGANYTFVEGINGQAISKDGGNINVSAGSGTGTLSFTMWVRYESDSNEYEIHDGLQIWNGRLQTFNGAWTPIQVNGSNVAASYMRSGEWVFIGYSLNGGSNPLFVIDGDVSSNFDGNNSLFYPSITLNRIGDRSKSTGDYDQFIKYNRALTEEELLLVYNNGQGTGFELHGCMQSDADNYNPLAGISDGSCYKGGGESGSLGGSGGGFSFPKKDKTVQAQRAIEPSETSESQDESESNTPSASSSAAKQASRVAGEVGSGLQIMWKNIRGFVAGLFNG